LILSLEDVRLFLEKSRKLLILCHSNADPDALGGAIALRRELVDKQIDIRCDGVSRPAKRMLDVLGETILEGPLEREPDSILVLDTSNPELLGCCKDFLELTGNIALVDHHATCSFDAVASFREARTSNAELVWELIGKSGDTVSRKALLSGILADTGHLKFSNRDTFGSIYEMLDDDIVFEDIFTMLHDDHDPSKVVALMKALQRMRVKKVKEYMIVKTNIGSHESFIAKNIMALGADVVIIVNDKKGERIVARAKKEAIEKGVDLSSLMSDIGKKYGGEGGGHPPAAGILGIRDFKSASDDLIEMIKKTLGE